MKSTSFKEFLLKTGPHGDFRNSGGSLARSVGQTQPVIVIGNEAADLDSMASAVLYAYYLNYTDPEVTVRPLIPIPRADFKLRTEAVYLFSKAGIHENMLNFVEDIDLNSLAANGRLGLILTDHNKPAAAYKHLSEHIARIIDHHADEQAYPDSAQTDIRPVGSACTIVAEYFLDKARDVIDQSVSTLLLGTILLDTVNLDPEAGRVTDTDRNVAKQLISMSGEDQQALFDALQFEKFNVSQLSSYDLLRKDYKEWQLGKIMCGIGSVLMSAEKWVEKDPSIAEAFRKYSDEHGLDVLISMNAFTSPDFTRHLGVYAKNPAVRQQLISFLEASDLQLEQFKNISDEDGVVFYNQKNLGISRKKLQPLLKDFFEQHSAR
ncbi:MAG: DHH family phosphoesterase [Spirochaetia bacterium]|nr:DHH family phosphoesterase [Spirochaetia bacterium]